MENNQRQRLFVDPNVQGALVRRFFLHWLVFVVAAFVLLFAWQILVSGDPIHGWSAAFHEVTVRNLPVFVALVVLLPVFLNDTVKLTHRFAGPIVRLRHGLADLAAAQPFEPIEIRKTDFWHDLIVNYNAVGELVASQATSTSGEEWEQRDERERHEPREETTTV